MYFKWWRIDQVLRWAKIHWKLFIFKWRLLENLICKWVWKNSAEFKVNSRIPDTRSIIFRLRRRWITNIWLSIGKSTLLKKYKTTYFCNYFLNSTEWGVPWEFGINWLPISFCEKIIGHPQFHGFLSVCLLSLSLLPACLSPSVSLFFPWFLHPSQCTSSPFSPSLSINLCPLLLCMIWVSETVSYTHLTLPTIYSV